MQIWAPLIIEDTKRTGFNPDHHVLLVRRDSGIAGVSPTELDNHLSAGTNNADGVLCGVGGVGVLNDLHKAARQVGHALLEILHRAAEVLMGRFGVGEKSDEQVGKLGTLGPGRPAWHCPFWYR